MIGKLVDFCTFLFAAPAYMVVGAFEGLGTGWNECMSWKGTIRKKGGR